MAGCRPDTRTDYFDRRQATAFQVREREELQPTFAQLQRKNANVKMRWFARGVVNRANGRDDFLSRNRRRRRASAE
jgi:hypothetical protein